MTVEIRSATFVAGTWLVDCVVSAPDGDRIGVHFVDLPETATQTEIEAAIAASYGA